MIRNVGMIVEKCYAYYGQNKVNINEIDIEMIEDDEDAYGDLIKYTFDTLNRGVKEKEVDFFHHANTVESDGSGVPRNIEISNIQKNINQNHPWYKCMANPSHQADPENNSKCVMKTDLGMCEPRPKNINDANHPNYDTYIYAWDGKTARSVGNTFPSINNELYSQLDNSSRTVSDETSCMVALAGLPAGATAWGARGEYAAAKAASKWLGRAVAGTGIGMAVMALSAAAYGGYCMIDRGTDEHGVKYENVPWNVIGPMIFVHQLLLNIIWEIIINLYPKR